MTSFTTPIEGNWILDYFVPGHGLVGGAVATIANGEIFGGDSGAVFKGTYTQNSNTQVSVTFTNSWVRNLSAMSNMLPQGTHTFLATVTGPDTFEVTVPGYVTFTVKGRRA